MATAGIQPVHHLYGAWPLHEINPEEQPALVTAGLRALALRGDENTSAHGSLHRALASARLKDAAGVYSNLRKITGNNMIYRSLMTSHNPNLETYNADAANALPAVLSEALVYSRPGIIELLPAVPEQLAKGTITGVRGRNQVRIDSLSWDLPARSATVTLTSMITQGLTLISRRGIASITTSATLTSSPLGPHARVISLTAGQQIQVTVGLPAATGTTISRLVNRRSAKVLDVNGGATNDGATVIQWAWTGGTNQQWRMLPNNDGSFRLASVRSGKVLDSPGGSSQGAPLQQWADNGGTNQWWKLVPATTSGYYRLVNVRNGWCVDIEGGSTTDGARTIQRPVSGEISQEWQIVAI